MHVNNDYLWENLNPREFEIIAVNYAKYQYPMYIWSLTKETGDDNRDFETCNTKKIMWGEAKHSKNINTGMSKSKWDVTLLSAQLNHSVYKLMYITCSKIPLSYIIRSEYAKRNKIEDIYYINRIILNEWLNQKPELTDFDEKYPVSQILLKLKPCKRDINYSDSALYFFNGISENRLVPCRALYQFGIYEFNFIIFSPENKKITFKNNTMDFTSDITIKNLSVGTVEVKKSYEEMYIYTGYTSLSGLIMVKSTKQAISFEYLINDKIYKKRFTVLENYRNAKDVINLNEKIRKITEASELSKNKVEYIQPFHFSVIQKSNRKIVSIDFSTGYYSNCSLLCFLLVTLFFDFEVQLFDKKIIEINLSNKIDPILLDIILGVNNQLIAKKAISCLKKSPDLIRLFEKNDAYSILKKSVILVSNADFLKKDAIEVFNKILDIFKNQVASDYLFIFNTPKNIREKIPVNADMLVLSMFKKGVSENEKTKKVLSNISMQLLADTLDNKKILLHPALSVTSCCKYLNAKTDNEIEKDFDYAITLADDTGEYFEPWDYLDYLMSKSNRHVVYVNIIRKIRNMFYKKTQFYEVLQCSELISVNKINQKHFKDFASICDFYQYADALNHCGSIKDSLVLFENISEFALKSSDRDIIQLGMEARTETFNIRFWSLDIKNLVKDIDTFIKINLKNYKCSSILKRIDYPFYNCLNRKMVTLYLIENYTEAEQLFNQCISYKQAENYVAFAYMDSARGLYKHDTREARRRLICAYSILGKLNTMNMEKRRYLDCCFELSYVDFILSNKLDKSKLLKQLHDQVIEIQQAGLNSILEKCYLKLAACHLIINEYKEAERYIDLLEHSQNFIVNKRIKLLTLHLKDILIKISIRNNLPDVLSEQKTAYTLVFNNRCSTEFAKEDVLIIESRLW